MAVDVVTGASGHIGGNLVRALLGRGRKVRVVVHGDTRAVDGLDVEKVVGDVRDLDSLQRAFEGADVVYHLAALISIAGDQRGEVPAINVTGVRNMARAARDCRVRRVVHCSSIHAYRIEVRGRPIDETAPRSDSTGAPYDRSKAAGEDELRRVVDEGLDAVVVNPTGVIGPFDFKRSRMGQVLLALYHRKMPSLLNGGFNWVDVRDVVSGMLAAAATGRTGENYILSGHWHSLRDLALMTQQVTGVRAPRIVAPMWLAQSVAPAGTLFAKLTGREVLLTTESLAPLQANREIDHSKATRELGYRPRPTLETVRSTFEWFASAGMIPANAVRPDTLGTAGVP